MPRGVELALRAARMAWEDAKLAIAADRIGISVGTAAGNVDLVDMLAQRTIRGERLSPRTAVRGFAHAGTVLGRVLERGPGRVTEGARTG